MYDIKSKSGELPFDFDGVGNIDLIVGKAGSTPFDLLSGFDLTICKVRTSLLRR